MMKRHKALMAFIAGWLVGGLLLSPKVIGGFFGKRSK